MMAMDLEMVKIKHAGTVRRIPEEQRWQVDNLERAQAVPWNTGNDPEPPFHLKNKGPPNLQ